MLITAFPVTMRERVGWPLNYVSDVLIRSRQAASCCSTCASHPTEELPPPAVTGTAFNCDGVFFLRLWGQITGNVPPSEGSRPEEAL